MVLLLIYFSSLTAISTLQTPDYYPRVGALIAQSTFSLSEDLSHLLEGRRNIHSLSGAVIARCVF
jgi:hypothetical protein